MKNFAQDKLLKGPSKLKSLNKEYIHTMQNIMGRKRATLGNKKWTVAQALSLNCCVSLDNSLNVSGPQVSHLKNEIDADWHTCSKGNE